MRNPLKLRQISIHTLREEGDWKMSTTATPTGNFYPRPPRGGRPAVVGLIGTTLVFLSTPSARRATEHHFDFLPGNLISIHALLEEGDVRPHSR